jgi:cytochrome c
MAFRGIVAWVVACGWFAAAGFLAVSADVVRTELAAGLEDPIALDVARDGRVILAERRGALKVWDPADAQMRTVGKLPVFSGPEDGILGLALHPGFMTNGWVFLYHGTIGVLENRVSRFTLSGESLDPSSQRILLRVPTLIPKPNHSGGGMAFDGAGNLYVGTGDYTRAGESDGFAPLDQRPGHPLNDSQRTARPT